MNQGHPRVSNLKSNHGPIHACLPIPKFYSRSGFNNRTGEIQTRASQQTCPRDKGLVLPKVQLSDPLPITRPS